MYYYTTPNYNVALNAKVGSSTIAKAIIQEFYPNINKKILNIKNPPHISDEDRQWHHLCPGTTKPDKPIILFVRDPIDRFYSACQQINIMNHNIPDLLNSLLYDDYFIRAKYSNILLPDREQEILKINNINKQRYKNRLKKIEKGLPIMPVFKRYGFIRDDIHFQHQHRYIQNDTYCFKFPDDFNKGLTFVGINKTISHSNKAKRQKIKLSDEQLFLIKEYYKTDINLYNSISEPGQLINKQYGELSCH